MFSLPERIAYDTVSTCDGEIAISTVNLMSLGEGIYETCVFGSDGSSEVINRTTDIGSAHNVHEQACELAVNWKGPIVNFKS